MDHNLHKRMAPMLILEILRAYTDEDHGLQVNEIVAYLESDYGITAERKAVSRVLNDLKELSEIPENNSNWKLPMQFTIRCDGHTHRTNWRLVGKFEDAELRLLIDAVLAIRNYPADRLLKNLEKQGSAVIRKNSQYVRALGEKNLGNKQMLVNVGALNKAIVEGKKVSFHYYEYGIDKKLHPRRDKTGQPRLYTVSPYQMAFRDGKYYLICNYDKYDDIAHYRIDRIRDIEVLSEPAQSFASVSGTQGWKINIRQYMDEHIYMYTGETITATFRIPEAMVSDVIDQFGENVDFAKAGDGCVTVRADVNRAAMVRFAKTFAPDVRVVAPANLVADVKKELEKALNIYGERDD